MKLQYQRYSIYFFLFCGLCYTCLVNASSGTAATTDAYTTGTLLRKTVCQPQITSVAPLSAAIGSSITISGINFQPTTNGNIVWFGGVKATIITATTTSLTVSVPPGAGNPIRLYTSCGMSQASELFVLSKPSVDPLSASTFSSQTTSWGFAIKNASFSSLSLHEINNLNYADVDGDNKLDVIFGRQRAFVQLNTTITAGTISSGTQGPGNTWLNASFETRFKSLNTGEQLVTHIGTAQEGDIQYGDMDGDGKLDVVSCFYRPPNDKVVVMRNTTTAVGSPSFSSTDFSTSGRWARRISLADFDTDGKLDIIVSTYSGGGAILRNQSTSGTISFTTILDIGFGFVEDNITAADIDNDGKLDLLYQQFNQTAIKVRRNTSTGIGNFSFGPEQSFTYSAINAGTENHSLGDLDNDGKIDLVIPVTDGFAYLKNTSAPGTISFAPYVNKSTGSAIVGYSSVGDLDGDGYNDIAFVPDGGYNCYVIKNTTSATPGTISFQQPHINLNPSSSLPQYTTGVRIGDFDGDGDNDIATFSQYTNGINYFSNESPMSTPQINTTGSLTAYSTCEGVASTEQSFTIDGSNLVADLIVTAPAGFELRVGSSGSYSSTTSLAPSSGVVTSTTINVRVRSTAPAGTLSGTIICSSVGATNKVVTATASVIAASVAGTATTTTSTICYGSTATVSLSGNTGTIQWQSSTNEASWSAIAGAITATHSSGALTQTTYYRAVVTSGVCSSATSGTVTVTNITSTTTLTPTSITLCPEATYLMELATNVPNANGWSASSPLTVTSAGYVTAGSSSGTGQVTYTDGCGLTFTTTVTVSSPSTVSSLSADRVAFKFNGNPQGPTLNNATINYVGTDGFIYYRQTQPTAVGFYKANVQTGAQAGCPTRFYIFNCTTCIN